MPQIIIVSPPHLGETDHPEMMVHFGEETAVAESKRFAHWYQVRASEHGVRFFDAATVAKPDSRDGVHLDPVNTRAIGEGLVPVVKEALGL